MNKKGELYCYGCGVKLQFNRPNREGYITQSAFEHSIRPLCLRCYNIKYHNRVSDVERVSDDYSKLFDNIIASKCLVVYVIDIFNFDLKTVKEMLSKLNNKVLFVINKVDILPQSVKKEKVIEWIKNLFPNRQIKKYIATSSQNNFNIDELREEIEKYRDGKSVYFIGSTNAGKSSIVNSFLKSCYANTTLQIVEIPLDRSSYIYDTPGFIEIGNISHAIESKIMNDILPKKEIKPQVYQVSSNQSYYIGGLFRIDVEPKTKASLIVYASSKMKIHRSKTEKANEIFTNLINNKQLYPVSKNYPDITRFEVQEIAIKGEKVDLVCPGYCRITLRKLNGTKIQVHVPKNVKLDLVEPLI